MCDDRFPYPELKIEERIALLYLNTEPAAADLRAEVRFRLITLRLARMCDGYLRYTDSGREMAARIATSLDEQTAEVA